ncbi:hypothetical protein Tco_0649473 [Tanacetum coccineum]
MKGTEMTKQEHEYMLYDEFDKFTSEPGESIHSYYLRYAKLINDMKMIPMSMSNMQINMKFVNHLQPEWSRFVTSAKLARDIHSHYQSNTPITQQLIQSPLFQSYAPIVVQQPPTFQPDTGFVAPTFLPTDDPIANIKKAMIFLSSAYSSRYPLTNNQLRTSSNLRTQVTIQNGQVTVQNVQGHIVKQCTAKKRVKDSEWFEDKMLLAQAQEAGIAYDIEAYDSDCDDEATTNAIFMENLSPVGSINDDMVEQRYDSDILSKIAHYDIYHDYDMLSSNIQELGYIENIVSNNKPYDELTSNINVISYTDYMLTIGNDADNYVPPPVQKNDIMLSVIEQMKSQVEKFNMVLINLNNARDLLSKFDECINRRTMLSPHQIGSWEQSDIKGAFKKDVIPFSKNLKETFKLFEKGFIAEV